MADERGNIANPVSSRTPEAAPMDDRSPSDSAARSIDRSPTELTEIGQRAYIKGKVQPLDLNGVRTMGFGALAWLVAFALLVPFYPTLQANDRVWWLWTCCAGFGLGLIGVGYCRRRRTQLAKHPEREPETSPLGAAGL